MSLDDVGHCSYTFTTRDCDAGSLEWDIVFGWVRASMPEKKTPFDNPQCAAPTRCLVERARRLRLSAAGVALSSTGLSLGSCGTNSPRKALLRMAWSSLGRSREALSCSTATRSSQAKAVSMRRTISCRSSSSGHGRTIFDSAAWLRFRIDNWLPVALSSIAFLPFDERRNQR
jgi:hypothetical protein